MSDSNSPQSRTSDFERRYERMRAGDRQAKEDFLRESLSEISNAIQRKFGAGRGVSVDDAVMSACATIERRGWRFQRGKGESTTDVIPRNWGELTGLFVVFAYNKARTQIRRRHATTTLDNPDGESPVLQLIDEDANHLAELFSAEQRQSIQTLLNDFYASLDESDRIILRGYLDGLSDGVNWHAIKSLLEEAETGVWTSDRVRMHFNRRIKPKLKNLMAEHQA